MSGRYATTLFRIVFAIAGGYNLAFGLWAGLAPSSFFDLFDIAPPTYPQIWACLGMVVGVYGLLYWRAAWRPEEAWPIIAVGLLGKVLGPIGMALSFSPSWPPRLGLLCVYNDIIWWLPFALFLVRGTRSGVRFAALAPWWCAGLHVLAIVMIAFALPGGTEVEPDPLERARYIGEHLSLWRLGWGVWMLAALSLVGLYAWWGARIPSGAYALFAPLIAGLGMVCDLTGESISSLVLVEHASAATPTGAWNEVAFLSAQRAATLLTAGAANALYTAGGVLLTLSTPDLPRPVRTGMWLTWVAGVGMTVSALAESTSGMVATTACLFPVFILWNLWMAWRWRG